jgi:Fe-S-cluster containining protein
VETTCCQQREIYVSPGDVRRIHAHTGLSGFFAYEVPNEPSYLDQDDDPLWRDNVIRPDGTRRVLRRANGNCMFLGPVGCMLPLEVRPLVCRLYPYDYTEEGIKPDLAEGCPLNLLRTGETLIDALGMNLSDAKRWHRQLYDEVRQEATTPVPLEVPAPKPC